MHDYSAEQLRNFRDMAEQMAACLQQAFAPRVLEVRDESHKHQGHAGANGSGYGTHFHIKIAATELDGLSRVAQHRCIYRALADFIDNRGVHALVIEVR